MKIRGHRIEPGEIEAALARLPQVREAVVVLHGATGDDRRLVAYVVAGAGQCTPTRRRSARDLRRTLPEYMIPAAFVFLAAMPLTANGKVDRSKLPDPEGSRRARGAGWNYPPADPSQRLVAAIWEELLGVRNIGARDNFFDLGGHSLLAARMVDRVEAQFGIKVPLAVLFTHATLEQFTLAMRDEGLRAQAPLLALNAGGARPPIFFLHGDFTGGGFFSKSLSRALGPEWPFYAVHPHGLLDPPDPGLDRGHGRRSSHRAARRASARPLRAGRALCRCAGRAGNGAGAGARRRAGALVFIIDAIVPLPQPRVFEGLSFGNVSARPSRRRLAPEPAPTAAPATPMRDDLPAGDAFARYREAMRRYPCAPYAGALVLLQSESTHDSRPALGWTAVNPDVVVHVVAGDHHTAITHHLPENAAILKACLEAAVAAG